MSRANKLLSGLTPVRRKLALHDWESMGCALLFWHYLSFDFKLLLPILPLNHFLNDYLFYLPDGSWNKGFTCTMYPVKCTLHSPYEGLLYPM